MMRDLLLPVLDQVYEQTGYCYDRTDVVMFLFGCAVSDTTAVIDFSAYPHVALVFSSLVSEGLLVYNESCTFQVFGQPTFVLTETGQAFVVALQAGLH